MRVLLLVGQCHVEVEGAGSLYWLDLLHMGPSPSPHWLCLLHNGPLEPNPLPSNPCLTLLPCVPSPVNTHLAFKRLQVPTCTLPPCFELVDPFLDLFSLLLQLCLPFLQLCPSPRCPPSCSSHYSCFYSSPNPLPSCMPLSSCYCMPLSCMLLIITPLLLLLLNHLFARLVSPQDHPSVATTLPSNIQLPCNHGEGKLH